MVTRLIWTFLSLWTVLKEKTLFVGLASKGASEPPTLFQNLRADWALPSGSPLSLCHLGAVMTSTELRSPHLPLLHLP